MPPAASFDALWSELLPVGRDPRTGGYRRFVWDAAELACREWFAGAAAARGLEVTADRDGNLWAWWGNPDAAGPGVVIGSHLDSVPDGGAYDGPLGVVSAFAALDVLRERGVVPGRPIGVVAFADEEGARFGVPCAGSRLLTGALEPARARALTDAGGTTYAEAMRAAGHDPERIGLDEEALGRIGTFVELHVEQGRALADLAAPVGVAGAVWAHGRWRFDFAGRADHAGTTRIADRADPMLPYANAVLAAREAAARRDGLATFGRVEVSPGATNAIPSRVTGWLDARGPDEPSVRALVADVAEASGAAVSEESWTPLVQFPHTLRDRLARLLGGAPVLPTGAGHDAAILATAGVPAAMLFVRNPTGVSHAPDEHAEREDCLAGVDAFARSVADLAENLPSLRGGSSVEPGPEGKRARR